MTISTNTSLQTSNIIDVQFQLDSTSNLDTLNMGLFVQQSVGYILELLCIHNSQVSFLLCHDSYMRCLNFKFRHKDEPTDVLSFPGSYWHYEGFLGDIAVSVDQARVKFYEYSFLQAILRLSLHGTLHLLGYDHETSLEKAKKMFRLERILFLEVSKAFPC